MIENQNENQNQPRSESTVKAVGSFIWELAKVFIVALLIIIPLRVFVAEPFIVSGSSMVPNFHNKEYLIIDKVSYRYREPRRDEVIVFKYPKDTTQYFIKRIIGLPGEKVKVDRGRVTVFNAEHPSGFVLDEPYIGNQAITFGSSEPVTLGTNEYFVLGDNRLASSDSRVWGILPKNDIVGKVWVRVFPIGNFGFIKTPLIASPVAQ
jgi:signal peptidase I